MLNIQGGTMEKKLLLVIKKHVRVLLIVCVVSWIFIYIMGHFTTLHPDAYRDMTRSILIVYGLYILVYILYNLVRKKVPLTKMHGRISTWWENETPIEAICSTFTIVTLINSIMMILGYDTPKQGVFAYIHMMTRLFIISCFVIVWMWKDAIQWAKKFEFRNSIRNFCQEAHKRPYASISKLFTIVTVAYCLFMIGFYRVIDSSGGMLFYQTLLGILAVITIYILLIFKQKSQQETKENP